MTSDVILYLITKLRLHNVSIQINFIDRFIGIKIDRSQRDG